MSEVYQSCLSILLQTINMDHIRVLISRMINGNSGSRKVKVRRSDGVFMLPGRTAVPTYSVYSTATTVLRARGGRAGNVAWS